jgi:3D (Asp-Asp-Asp) domain-containing protein
MKKLMIMFAVFWQVMNVSAYCETGNRTASGVWPAVGMAAADHLPFGSKVTLPDGTVVVIRDRMGGNYTDRLDLFMGTEGECWTWGRRWLRCKIETP